MALIFLIIGAGMTGHFEFEQWVAFQLGHVFAFFSNPENLPRIMPSASGTRLIAVHRVPATPDSKTPDSGKAAGAGSVIVTSVRAIPFLPLRARWIARITEFEWNHHFADVQEQGPFKSWQHRHEFEAVVREEVEGTLIRDLIDYEIGWGFLGMLADSLFVREQIESTFAERQKKLPDLLSTLHFTGSTKTAVP
ncbi:MAG TPA: SRPBCC family protein [Candidatus Sulfotelmatobacter sp.]|nr:SRPBCC family protein [Candidatus Sulfotelmatobacter sp.]